MTLADVLPAVQQLSGSEKRELIRLLTVELSDNSDDEDLSPLESEALSWKSNV